MAETEPTTAETPTDAGVLQRAEQAERQRDEYYQLLKQAQADFENAHRRNLRERENERLYAAQALAKDLLPVLDNLNRALAASRESAEGGPLAQGVELVREQILDAFKRHGITPIDALHQPFDPNLHQAVMQMPVADHPPNTVIQVLEQGFLIRDRLLRVASVIVSAEAPSA